MKKIIRSSWEIEEEYRDDSVGETIVGETIYEEDGRDNLLDEGQIDLWELAFMEGWDAAQ